MNNVKEQTEYYRIGLPHGLFDISEVISWCDSVIMAEDAPDIAIIEASIAESSGAEAIAHHLKAVGGEVDRPLVVRRLLRLMIEIVESDKNQAANIAHAIRLFGENNYLPCEESELGFFDSAMTDARHGYFEIEDVIKQMLESLEKYAVPR